MWYFWHYIFHKWISCLFQIQNKNARQYHQTFGAASNKNTSVTPPKPSNLSNHHENLYRKSSLQSLLISINESFLKRQSSTIQACNLKFSKLCPILCRRAPIMIKFTLFSWSYSLYIPITRAWVYDNLNNTNLHLYTLFQFSQRLWYWNTLRSVSINSQTNMSTHSSKQKKHHEKTLQ